MQKITDAYLRNLKGTEKLREVFVDECLFLKVSLRKDGRTSKRWLLRYSDAGGRQTRLTFGEYPEIGLAEARARAIELRKRAKQGPTLAEQAKQRKIGQTFADLAAEWLDKKKEGWVDGHALRQGERLGTICRVFGAKDISDVSMDDVIAAVGQKTAAGALETARRSLSLIRQVLEYADTLGRLEDNRILTRIDSFRKTLTARGKKGTSTRSLPKSR